jgi:hypothetical protein
MTSMTGIPIEVLFAALGGLVTLLALVLGFIGTRILSAIGSLQKESVKRGRQLAVFRVFLAQLCAKAGIHFPDNAGNGEGEDE